MSSEPTPTSPGSTSRRYIASVVVMALAVIVLAALLVRAVGGDSSTEPASAEHMKGHNAAASHAAMYGKGVPAPKVSKAEYDALLYPPAAEPYKPGACVNSR